MSSLIRYIYTLVIIEKENVASDKFCSANQIYEFFPTLSPKLDNVKIHVLTKHIWSYKTCKWISNPTSSGTEWSSTLRVAFRLAGVLLLLLINILWWSVCLFVCNKKWSLPPGSLLWPPEPPITTLYNSMLVLMVPDWFFMVPFRFL